MPIKTEVDLDRLAEVIDKLAFFSDALIAWNCQFIEFNNHNTDQLGANLAQIVEDLKAVST